MADEVKAARTSIETADLKVLLSGKPLDAAKAHKLQRAIVRSEAAAAFDAKVTAK
jgi:hypothetical protein